MLDPVKCAWLPLPLNSDGEHLVEYRVDVCLLPNAEYFVKKTFCLSVSGIQGIVEEEKVSKENWCLSSFTSFLRSRSLTVTS